MCYMCGWSVLTMGLCLLYYGSVLTMGLWSVLTMGLCLLWVYGSMLTKGLCSRVYGFGRHLSAMLECCWWMLVDLCLRAYAYVPMIMDLCIYAYDSVLMSSNPTPHPWLGATGVTPSPCVI